MKQKNITRDHGKPLYDTIVVLLLLLGVLWYLTN
jgi:hypothetical protein